ncbi:MAG: hypothetical protein ABI462_07220 [Ignavibacteria bacterium]
MIAKDIVEKKIKIKRKKFFLYSGAVALGIYTASKIPFNFFQTKQSQKVSSIKITQNPHAVKRKAREVNNG